MMKVLFAVQILLLAVILPSLATPSNVELIAGRNQYLEICDDSRHSFFVNSFLFAAGGIYNLSVVNIQGLEESDHPMCNGFLIFQGASPKLGFYDADSYRLSDSDCAFVEQNSSIDVPGVQIIALDAVFYPFRENSFNYSYQMNHEDAGYWNTFFISSTGSPVSFELYLDQYNYRKGVVSYLAPSQEVMISFYFTLVVIYFVICGYWLSGSSATDCPQKMFIFALLLNLTSVFLSAIELREVKNQGSSQWSLPLVAIEGMFNLIIILLVPALSKKIVPGYECRKFWVGLACAFQLVATYSGVHRLETSPGMSSWLLWGNIGRVTDLLSFACVYMSQIWTSKEVRSARTFKIISSIFLVYMYCTRVILIPRILANLVSYEFCWIPYVLIALADVFFLCYVGRLSSNEYMEYLKTQIWQRVDV